MTKDIPYRYDLLPPEVLIKKAQLMWKGLQKHTEGDWQELGVQGNLNHAIAHIMAYTQTKDYSHLAKAGLRCDFALSLAIKENSNGVGISIKDTKEGVSK
jgi:hypothetical protein